MHIVGPWMYSFPDELLQSAIFHAVGGHVGKLYGKTIGHAR